MKVYIVYKNHKYEGFCEILKIFSDSRKADEYIEDFPEKDKKMDKRRKQLKIKRDKNYFKILEKEGILPGTPECINYPLEKAVEIDDAFYDSLSEYDKECFYHFKLNSSESVLKMEMEVE